MDKHESAERASARDQALGILIESFGAYDNEASRFWAERQLKIYALKAEQTVGFSLLSSGLSLDPTVVRHHTLRMAYNKFEQMRRRGFDIDDEGLMLGCLELAEPDPAAHQRFLDQYQASRDNQYNQEAPAAAHNELYTMMMGRPSNG